MSDDRFSMPDLPPTEPEQQTEIPSYRPIQPIQLPEQNPAMNPQQQSPAQYPNNPQQQSPAQYPNTPQPQSPAQYPNTPQQQNPAQYPNTPQQQIPAQYPNTPQRPPVYQQMQQTPTPDNRPLPFSQDIMRLLSLPPITKAEAEFCRHSHEKRWFRRLTAINILLIISAIVLMISSFGEYKKTMKRFTEDVTAEMLQSISEQMTKKRMRTPTKKSLMMMQKKRKRRTQRISMQSFTRICRLAIRCFSTASQRC